MILTSDKQEERATISKGERLTPAGRLGTTGWTTSLVLATGCHPLGAGWVGMLYIYLAPPCFLTVASMID